MECATTKILDFQSSSHPNRFIAAGEPPKEVYRCGTEEFGEIQAKPKVIEDAETLSDVLSSMNDIRGIQSHQLALSFGQSAGTQPSAADVQTLLTKKGLLALSNIQETIGEIHVQDSAHDVADETLPLHRTLVMMLLVRWRVYKRAATWSIQFLLLNVKYV